MELFPFKDDSPVLGMPGSHVLGKGSDSPAFKLPGSPDSPAFKIPESRDSPVFKIPESPNSPAFKVRGVARVKGTYFILKKPFN